MNVSVGTLDVKQLNIKVYNYLWCSEVCLLETLAKAKVLHVWNCGYAAFDNFHVLDGRVWDR